jgi:DNA repair protein RadC
MSVVYPSCAGAQEDGVLYCAESREASRSELWTRQRIGKVAQPARWGPELRELTYGYRTKTDSDGRPLRLGPMIADSRDAARVLADLLGHEAIEVFGMLCLTAKHHVICWHEVTRGCLDRTFVHPREVFKPAMMANAAAIVIGHNHPSGDPEPSPDDFETTTRLVEIGRLLKLPVIDHVIVGDGSFVSLRNVCSLSGRHKPSEDTWELVNSTTDSQKLAVSA